MDLFPGPHSEKRQREKDKEREDKKRREKKEEEEEEEDGGLEHEFGSIQSIKGITTTTENPAGFFNLSSSGNKDKGVKSPGGKLDPTGPFTISDQEIYVVQKCCATYFEASKLRKGSVGEFIRKRQM